MNVIPETKKLFLFININRLGKDKEKMGLIMHETMHLSLEIHKRDVEKKEEEIITWAENEAYKIYDIIEKEYGKI
jgi:K+/H+ antiporter YhaU regulatory subunit KhtT